MEGQSDWSRRVRRRLGEGWEVLWGVVLVAGRMVGIARGDREGGQLEVGGWESIAIQVSLGGRNWHLWPHYPEAVGGSADP